MEVSEWLCGAELPTRLPTAVAFLKLFELHKNLLWTSYLTSGIYDDSQQACLPY